MDIIPLGVGGAFTQKFYHNNYIFKLGHKTLLVDAGTTLRYSLQEAGFTHTDIDYILVTHFHSDHIGGLEEFLQSCYFRLVNGEHKPYKPTLLMLESQRELFDRVLSLGLYNQGLTLFDYCNVQMIHDLSERNHEMMIGPYKIEWINTSNLHVQDMHSFAIKVYQLTNHVNIIFTSDIKHLSQSGIKQRINEQTKAVFQDLHLQPTPVHATLKEIMEYYPPDFFHNVYLMHYPDQIEEHMTELTAHGFKLVEQGVPITFY